MQTARTAGMGPTYVSCGPALETPFKAVLLSSPLWQLCDPQTQQALRLTDKETRLITYSHLKDVHVKVPSKAPAQPPPEQLAAFIGRITNLTSISFINRRQWELQGDGLAYASFVADYIAELLSYLSGAPVLQKVQSCRISLHLPPNHSPIASCVAHILLSLPALNTFAVLSPDAKAQRQLFVPLRFATNLKQLRIEPPIDTDVAELMVQQLEHLPKLTKLIVPSLCCSLAMLQKLVSSVPLLQTLVIGSLVTSTETQDPVLSVAEGKGVRLPQLHTFGINVASITMHALHSVLAMMPAIKQLLPSSMLILECSEPAHAEANNPRSPAEQVGTSSSQCNQAIAVKSGLSVALEVLPKLFRVISPGYSSRLGIRLNKLLADVIRHRQQLGAHKWARGLPALGSFYCTLDITGWSELDDVPPPPQPQPAGHPHSVHELTPPLRGISWSSLATIAAAFPSARCVHVTVTRTPLNEIPEAGEDDEEELQELHGQDMRSLRYWEILRIGQMLVTLCNALPAVTTLQLDCDKDVLHVDVTRASPAAAVTQVVLDLAACTQLNAFELDGMDEDHELTQACHTMLAARGSEMVFRDLD